MTKTPTLQEVVGRNVQRIRNEHGRTQAALARTARTFGLKWHDTRVSELEKGSLPLSVETLLALAAALQHSCDAELTLADLFEGAGSAVLNETALVKLSRLRDVVRGADVSRMTERGGIGYSLDGIESFRADQTDLARSILGDAYGTPAYHRYARRAVPSAVTESKALRSLGVTASILAALSYRAWGHALADERERRAAPGDSPQKRGRITRELLAELADILASSNG